MIKELKTLHDDCRSNSCIEHAAGILEEMKAPEKLSKKISTISLAGGDKKVSFSLVLKFLCSEQGHVHCDISTVICCWSKYNFLYMLQPEKFLLEKLDVYESAVGDSNTKVVPHIQPFPPEFQTIPRNPIVLDLAFNAIDFPSLENRMKKDKKGFISRLWRWVWAHLFVSLS